VKVLLDTHIFLWLQTDPARLRGRRSIVEDRANTLLLSAASAWEIAIKYALGRLDLPDPPADYVPERLRLLDGETVPIEHRHALAVAELPLLHRDPFDRVLIAQARLLDVPIMTADPRIAQYEVQTLSP
jgi:PIN domain nuclease of toxin-antitoxin system